MPETKTTSYPTHGGARPGAGRPPLTPAAPGVAINVILTQWHLDRLDDIPGSNRSAKIRELIERYIDGDDAAD